MACPCPSSPDTNFLSTQLQAIGEGEAGEQVIIEGQI